MNLSAGFRIIFLSTILFISSLPIPAQDRAPASEEILQKMLELAYDDFSVQVRAGKWLLALNDISVIPAFMDAMQLVETHRDIGWLLDEMTGQSIGHNWPGWMEWLGRQEFDPHPAYPFFKQRLYRLLDPALAAFLNPGYTSTIRLDEVVWGGVKKDGIPALINPPLRDAESAEYLEDDDEIIGLVVNGQAHAFPLRILNWHELLNIRIAGEPVTLVYCTLCGTALSYIAQVAGVTYTFGTSGLLYRSNKLMYDHQTNTLWLSIYGRPVLGKLAGRDMELQMIANLHSTWKQWREMHPATKVLDIDTGYDRDYNNTNPYQAYAASARTMFPVAQRNNSLQTKDWVFGINSGGRSKAYPLTSFNQSQLINDVIGDSSIVLIGEAHTLSVRAYKTGTIKFKSVMKGKSLLDSDGQQWEINEDQLSNTISGETLERMPGRLLYWFAWYAFYTDTEIWVRGDLNTP